MHSFPVNQRNAPSCMSYVGGLITHFQLVTRKLNLMRCGIRIRIFSHYQHQIKINVDFDVIQIELKWIDALTCQHQFSSGWLNMQVLDKVKVTTISLYFIFGLLLLFWICCTDCTALKQDWISPRGWLSTYLECSSTYFWPGSGSCSCSSVSTGN